MALVERGWPYDQETASAMMMRNLLLRKALIYPVILLIPLLLFTVLRISGTSEGMYHLINYGGQKDPNLIAGRPRPIRSDEWLVSTQMVIAQAAAGYPVINPNIGNGENMSVILDVPYKEWSAAFKPQNFSFFVMPLENAFAFRWWLLLVLLGVSSYLFVLELAPGKYTLAAMFSAFFSLSPMVFWWYETGTLAPLFYGLFLAIVFMRLLRAQTVKMRLLLGALMAYLLTDFALIMYPPFQIPVAIVIAVFCLGYLIQNLKAGVISRRAAVTALGVTAGAAVVCAGIVAGFLFTRFDAVQAVTHTAYPGQREVVSGGLRPIAMFSSFLSPQLVRRVDGTYFSNQSDESNFIFVAPFLLIPGFLLFMKDIRQKKPFDWPLHLINILLVVLLIRVFVPAGSTFFKLLLLDKVPHNRLLLGFGLLGFVQLILLWRRLDDLFESKLQGWGSVFLSSVAALATFLWIGGISMSLYPNFVPSWKPVIVMALAVVAGVGLFLARKTYVALGLLILFSFVSVYRIHPLYIGLGEIYKSPLADAIKNSDASKQWGAAGSLYIENVPQMAGRDSITGTYTYPQLTLWEHEDPANPRYSFVYNRYAHTLFRSGGDDHPKLNQTDFFTVPIHACGDYAQQHLGYILSMAQLNEPCLTLSRTFKYPVTEYYIYKVTSP